MKKWTGFACAAAFALLCAGVWLFFQPLTETTGTIPYIEWETACLVSADGQASPPGGGESLVMELVPDGQMALFPPLLRLTEDPSAQAETIAPTITPSRRPLPP